MRFSQIPANGEAKRILITQVNAGTIPHAQLFHQRSGGAGLALAFAFASYVMCTNRGATDSCGACDACIKTDILAHPDLHLIFPVNKSASGKEGSISEAFLPEFRELVGEQLYFDLQDFSRKVDFENRQPIISVEEVTRLNAKLSLLSYESAYKVVLFWLPEKMNLQAANKILKLLEEPTDNTLFILVCNQPEELLPTVISRTQRIFVEAPTDDLVKAILMEQAIDERTASEFALAADGDIAYALRMAGESELVEENLKLFTIWMRACFNPARVEIREALELLGSMKREGQKLFLSYCSSLLRQAFLMNEGLHQLNKLRPSETEFLNKFSAFVHRGNCRRILDEFSRCESDIEGNINPRIMFADATLNLYQFLQIKKTNA